MKQVEKADKSAALWTVCSQRFPVWAFYHQGFLIFRQTKSITDCNSFSVSKCIRHIKDRESNVSQREDLITILLCVLLLSRGFGQCFGHCTDTRKSLSWPGEFITKIECGSIARRKGRSWMGTGGSLISTCDVFPCIGLYWNLCRKDTGQPCLVNVARVEGMAGTGGTKRFGASHNKKASFGPRTGLLREWISKPIKRLLKLIDIQWQVFKKEEQLWIKWPREKKTWDKWQKNLEIAQKRRRCKEVFWQKSF